jgi:ABC-type multidrug transport system ATPase subunit
MDEAERCSHLAYIYYGHLIADGTPDQLRELPEVNPEGTHRFEVTVHNVTSALRKTRDMKMLFSSTIFGRAIHCQVAFTVSAAELAEEMKKYGIEVEDIRPLLPSLEDVFVELTHQRQFELDKMEREAASRLAAAHAGKEVGA